MPISQLIWLFFSPSGRLGRAPYFLAFMLASLVPAFFLYRFLLLPQGGSGSQMWEGLFGIAFLATIWANGALGIKRLHDVGQPAIYAISLFIPVISIVAFVALCLFPGDPGPNKYGPHTNAPK